LGVEESVNGGERRGRGTTGGAGNCDIESIAMGHKLRPRLLITGDSDLFMIGMVLQKMARQSSIEWGAAPPGIG